VWHGALLDSLNVILNLPFVILLPFRWEYKCGSSNKRYCISEEVALVALLYGLWYHSVFWESCMRFSWIVHYS